MAADDERAQRFRDTYDQRKAQDPRAYTWKRLADHVGISERAVQDWAKTGGVDYDNAKKAAEFWEVDFDWLWRGPKDETGTPDPFAAGDLDTRLANIEQALANRIDHDRKIDTMLERQTAILRRIETLVLALPTDEETEELLRAARGEDQPDQQDKRAPAKDERDTGARRRAEG